MDYLDLLSDPRVAGTNWHPIFAMLHDHRVARFLQDQGYYVLQFGSWWNGTHRSAIADENHPDGFSEFPCTTCARPCCARRSACSTQPVAMPTLDWDNGQCQRVARQLEELKAIGDREDAGLRVRASPGSARPVRLRPRRTAACRSPRPTRGRLQGYVDQVAYADRIIEEIVDALQDVRHAAGHSDPGRRGPLSQRDYDVPWQDAAAEETCGSRPAS